jgi:cysteine desulfurase / selenocysteine lyase
MSIETPPMHSDSNSAPDWHKYRLDYFPVVKKWAYFDHAALSPLPVPARDAIADWLAGISLDGDTDWLTWNSRVEKIRARVASLFNAEEIEVAFVPNTAVGISTVAEGLSWETGDNVVIPQGEFPSNLYPWMNLQNKGVELRIVKTGPFGEIDLNRVSEACDARTRVVAMSWVGYSSGFRIDPAAFAAVAHDHNAFFVLDAIQGLGVFPLDVQSMEIDFLAASGHKWLMGPEGAGLMYCNKRLLEQLVIRGIGWNSVQNPYLFHKVDLRLKESAARYEGGTRNMAGIHALGASLDLLAEIGLTPTASPLAERVLGLTDKFCSELEKIGFQCQSVRHSENSSGIVSFQAEERDAAETRNLLLQNGVVSSVRHGLLRFSPHAYNNEEDIEKAVHLLQNSN